MPSRSAPFDATVDVDAKLLYLAYDRLIVSLALTMVVTAVFVGLVWPFFPGYILAIWGAGIVSVVALRLLIWRLYRQARPAPNALRPWRILYFFGAVMAGAAWTVGPVLLVIYEAALAEVGIPLLVGTLLSVGAVAMNAQAAQRAAMQAFLLAELVPFILALALCSVTSQGILALVLLAGMLSLLIVGRASSVGIRALLETQASLHNALQSADQARLRAEAASLAKSRFLANMSHELRTPLNAVIGAAQLLRTQSSNPQQQAYLCRAIERSGGNLLSLIENILDLSRIEAGQLRLKAADFDLTECVESALASSALAAQAKDIGLECVIDPAVGRARFGDPDRLRQTIMNLLGNAVKFTSRGTVTVRVARAGTGPGVRISVCDTGIGIDSSVLPHIFEPFRQGEDAADRRFGGTGLGLAIVRQLVEAMGGTIHVISEPGRGSTFEFEIPLPPARGSLRHLATGSGLSTRPEGNQAGRPGTVLVVEDDELNRVVVSGLLQQAGYEVRSAESGREAIRQIAHGSDVDLVLMDLQMPGMDGLEVTQRLRAGEAGEWGRQVPIVALTANAFSEDRQACLDGGMNDYLTKPVVSERMLSTIERWMIAKPAQARTPARQKQVADPAEGHEPALRRAVFDPSVIASLPMVASGSSPAFAPKLLRLFLDGADKTLTDICDAHANNEQQTLLRLVHTLKSSCAAIGALELSDIAREYESALRSNQLAGADLPAVLAQAFSRLNTELESSLRHYAAQAGSVNTATAAAPL